MPMSRGRYLERVVFRKQTKDPAFLGGKTTDLNKAGKEGPATEGMATLLCVLAIVARAVSHVYETIVFDVWSVRPFRSPWVNLPAD